MRVLALDHGEARCGVAISDPTGSIATPLPEIERPDSNLAAVAELVAERGAERIVVGLPLTLSGDEGEQAARARVFAEALQGKVSIPVELHDERLTTRLAERTGGGAGADSRAAAHLLESWLARAGAAAE